MKRQAGDAILIGDDIEIHLVHIGRTRVKIGIQAPRHVPVVAKEVRLVGEENRAAAGNPALASLLAATARRPRGTGAHVVLAAAPAMPDSLRLDSASNDTQNDTQQGFGKKPGPPPGKMPAAQPRPARI